MKTEKGTTEEVTEVVFRIWTDGPTSGTALALFPYIIYDDKGNCLSYAHVGQHGAADYALCLLHSRGVQSGMIASEREAIRALRAELEGVGYNLTAIVKRDTAKYREAVTEFSRAMAMIRDEE